MATLLTSREVAALLSVSVRSLERWRVSGKVDLPFVKITYAWLWHGLLEWKARPCAPYVL
jgi:hypothetical protein